MHAQGFDTLIGVYISLFAKIYIALLPALTGKEGHVIFRKWLSEFQILGWSSDLACRNSINFCIVNRIHTRCRPPVHWDQGTVNVLD